MALDDTSHPLSQTHSAAWWRILIVCQETALPPHLNLPHLPSSSAPFSRAFKASENPHMNELLQNKATRTPHTQIETVDAPPSEVPRFNYKVIFTGEIAAADCVAPGDGLFGSIQL